MTNINIWNSTLSFFITFAISCVAIGNQGPLSPWVGVWSGACLFKQTNSEGGPVAKELGMVLRVDHVSDRSYNWVIQYELEPARNYIMFLPENRSPDRWQLDEKNGILIERMVDFEQREISELYTVNGRIFSAVTKFDGENLVLDSRSFWSQGTTGSQHTGSGTPVNSFFFSTSQVCILKRS